MIDLTPLEVRKKKGDFRKSMRGYDPALVDDFLDLAADRMEQLVRENMSFSDRVTRLEGLVADYREREKALTEALVTAQEMREETRRQATRDADLLRREAEAEAADIRASAHSAKEKEEDALRRVRAQRAQLIKSFRSFLERELSELAVAEEALGLRRRGTRPREAPVTADLFDESRDEYDDREYDDNGEDRVSPAALKPVEEEPRPRRRAPKMSARESNGAGDSNGAGERSANRERESAVLQRPEAVHERLPDPVQHAPAQPEHLERAAPQQPVVQRQPQVAEEHEPEYEQEHAGDDLEPEIPPNVIVITRPVPISELEWEPPVDDVFAKAEAHRNVTYDVDDFAPREDVRPPSAPRPRVAERTADETQDLFPGQVASARADAKPVRERAKPTSLAALEEEVLRELREQSHSSEKAALLSSVLEEEV